MNNCIIYYIYGVDGVAGFKYDKTEYLYRKNIQGDVTHIYTEDGEQVGHYTYDAWGNAQILQDKNGIAELNPFRYRSYYYDEETGFYYLQTRYYDPELGRFISADSIEYLDPETLGGLNLYAYCFDNPIMYIDKVGNFPILSLILGVTALVGLGLTIGGVATDNNVMTAIGLTMVAVPALISGGIALVGGIATGATLTAIVGGITVAAGIGTGLFASAEIQQATGNGNWMLDAGMSEGWYNGLMLTVATIATLGTFASSFCSSFNIKSIESVGKFTKYKNGSSYYGMKFKTGAGKTRVLQFHTHAHTAGKGVSEWHWQLSRWNPRTQTAAKRICRWIWWNLKKF